MGVSNAAAAAGFGFERPEAPIGQRPARRPLPSPPPLRAPHGARAAGAPLLPPPTHTACLQWCARSDVLARAGRPSAPRPPPAAASAACSRARFLWRARMARKPPPPAAPVHSPPPTPPPTHNPLLLATRGVLAGIGGGRAFLRRVRPLRAIAGVGEGTGTGGVCGALSNRRAAAPPDFAPVLSRGLAPLRLRARARGVAARLPSIHRALPASRPPTHCPAPDPRPRAPLRSRPPRRPRSRTRRPASP